MLQINKPCLQSQKKKDNVFPMIPTGESVLIQDYHDKKTKIYGSRLMKQPWTIE